MEYVIISFVFFMYILINSRMEINNQVTNELSEKKVEEYSSPDFEVVDILYDQQILSSSELPDMHGDEW